MKANSRFGLALLSWLAAACAGSPKPAAAPKNPGPSGSQPPASSSGTAPGTPVLTRDQAVEADGHAFLVKLKWDKGPKLGGDNSLVLSFAKDDGGGAGNRNRREFEPHYGRDQCPAAFRSDAA